MSKSGVLGIFGSKEALQVAVVKAAAQIFGADADHLAEAARIIEDLGFDMIDLNLGCPAKRVVACNGGSGLLRDLPLIALHPPAWLPPPRMEWARKTVAPA